MLDLTGGVPRDEEPPLYTACITAAIAPMHDDARIASQQVSQQVGGHLVDVVDEAGEWVRARGADGYEGWVHSGFLRRVRAGQPAPADTLASLGCTTVRADGSRRSLPLRALLAPGERVTEGAAVPLQELAARFPAEAAAIARSAEELFRGTSYIWGGVTPWGADCSGLVQTVHALHGVQLPRDAWQQAELGAPAPDDPGGQRAGDLLFFSDRADRYVTHVGIALGGARMVHLALGRGGYAVERLDDAADGYVTRLLERFLFARRLLD
jgi:gamma-D-glutamyl-L-lysine dipeptidyl-peptidase